MNGMLVISFVVSEWFKMIFQLRYHGVQCAELQLIERWVYLQLSCPYLGLCGMIYYLPLQMESQSEAQGIFTVSQVFTHKLKSNYKTHLKMLQESIQIVDCEAQLSFNYHTDEIRCISVPLHLYRLIKVILHLPHFKSFSE